MDEEFQELVPIEQAAGDDASRIELARKARYGLIEIFAERKVHRFRPALVLPATGAFNSQEGELLDDGRRLIPTGESRTIETHNVIIERGLWAPEKFGDPARDIWLCGCDRIDIRDGGFIEIFGARVAGHDSQTASIATSPPKNRGGRPPKWDWEEAMAHVGSLAASDPDGFEGPNGELPTHSEIARIMGGWFADRHAGDAPTDGELRKRGKMFVEALRRTRSKGLPKTSES